MHRSFVTAARSLALGLSLLGLSRAASAAPPMTPESEKEKSSAEPKGDALAGKWGDFALSVVERFGRISVPSDAERGQSGALKGSGMEFRVGTRSGLGAYYRIITAATSNNDGADWYHAEYAFGFAGRLHASGKPGFWQFHTQSRIELGILYSQLGTNQTCSTSYAPWGTSCDSTVPSPFLNASGAGWGVEMRLAGEIGFGPIGLGLDVGASANHRWSTGESSVSIPFHWFVPSAQLKIALVLPTG
jgi:hypothetical protein